MYSFNSDFHKIMRGKFALSYLKGVNTLMYTQKPLTPTQEIIFQRTLTSSLQSTEEVRKIIYKMRTEYGTDF